MIFGLIYEDGPLILIAVQVLYTYLLEQNLLYQINHSSSVPQPVDYQLPEKQHLFYSLKIVRFILIVPIAQYM